MDLPFTIDQFLAVFADYNAAVWPIQIVLNVLGLGAVYAAVRSFPRSDQTISGILGLLWLWIGIVYHLIFFSSINPAAIAFGVLTATQGMLFIIAGAVRRLLVFRFTPGLRGYAGALLIVYSLLAYPLLGHALGHVYPQSPTFGLPCPTTIFTFGLLLWTRGSMPRWVLVIPAIWSLIGFTAALTLGILEDIGLLVAGIVGVGLSFWRPKETQEVAVE